jgi:carbamate kinase
VEHRLVVSHGNGPQVGLLALPAGSMGPKVDVAVHFATSTGNAVIGTLTDLPEILSGRAGSRIATTSTGVSDR